MTFTNRLLISLNLREYIIVFVGNALDDLFDKGVFLRSKISLLDFAKQFLPTCLGDTESFSNSTTLQSDFCSVF